MYLKSCISSATREKTIEIIDEEVIIGRIVKGNGGRCSNGRFGKAEVEWRVDPPDTEYTKYILRMVKTRTFGAIYDIGMVSA